MINNDKDKCDCKKKKDDKDKYDKDKCDNKKKKDDKNKDKDQFEQPYDPELVELKRDNWNIQSCIPKKSYF